MSIIQHISHRVANWSDKILALLQKDDDRFDVTDFRVGTLVGTALIGLVIPLVNRFSDFQIIDLPVFRYGLIIFQLLLVLASYQTVSKNG